MWGGESGSPEVRKKLRLLKASRIQVGGLNRQGAIRLEFF